MRYKILCGKGVCVCVVVVPKEVKRQLNVGAKIWTQVLHKSNPTLTQSHFSSLYYLNFVKSKT